jgi:hypothetical protein
MLDEVMVALVPPTIEAIRDGGEEPKLYVWGKMEI